MVFNSKTGRVAFEPGDTIRCRNQKEAGVLVCILCDRGINWDYLFEKDGKTGLWVEILAEEAAEQ